MHQRRGASIKFMPGSLLLYQWENPKLLQSTETLHIYDRGWTNTLCGNRTTGLNGKCVSPGVSSYNKYASEAIQYRNSSERPISTMASMVIDSLCNFSLNIYFLSLTCIFQIQLPFRRVSILSTGGRINSLFLFFLKCFQVSTTCHRVRKKSLLLHLRGKRKYGGRIQVLTCSSWVIEANI